MAGKFSLREISNKEVEVTWQQHLEQRGHVPDFLIRTNLSDSPLKSQTRLKALAESNHARNAPTWRNAKILSDQTRNDIEDLVIPETLSHPRARIPVRGNQLRFIEPDAKLREYFLSMFSQPRRCLIQSGFGALKFNWICG
jgi:hypothetical protein